MNMQNLHASLREVVGQASRRRWASAAGTKLCIWTVSGERVLGPSHWATGNWNQDLAQGWDLQAELSESGDNEVAASWKEGQKEK